MYVKKLKDTISNGLSRRCYEFKKPKLQPPALRNIGANCYLNSAFQGISACDIFVKDINDLCNQYKDGNVEQLNVFKELLAIMNGCSKQQMEISRNSIFRKWNKTGQQDSYEVLVHVVNEVYNELRGYKVANGDIEKRDLQAWLKERIPMRFILQYNITCHCGSQSCSPLQSDLALHVVIPRDRQMYKLNQLIDRYFDEETIEDFKCDNKQCKFEKATKFAKLHAPLPRTVCIHLQRTYWNGFAMEKINNDVQFDNTITIKSKYCIEDKNPLIFEELQRSRDGSNHSEKNSLVVSRQREKGRNNEQTYGANGNYYVSKSCDKSKHSERSLHNSDSTSTTICPKYDDGDRVYEIVSVIAHSGTVYGGHYVCYKRVGDNWFLTNDYSVHEVKDSEVLRCQAYILFYEQLDH